MANSCWILIVSLLALLGIVARADTVGPGQGFIGYGITLFEPTCAFACSMAMYVPLNCTTADLAIVQLRRRDEVPAAPVYPSGDGWQVTASATPTCMARNAFYLSTLAYCLKTHCTSTLSLSAIESFWEAQLVKLPDGSGPKPYTEVLAAITETPTRQLNQSDVLAYTAVFPDELYSLYHNNVYDGAMNEVANSKYSLILLLTGAIIPIGISLLRFLPWPASWVTKVNAYIIDPPLVGSKHSTPVWGLGIMPTRGQALFILYLWASNVALSSVGYENRLGNWYATPGDKLERNMANRFGVLCYANVPLVILYAGRNNFLLWVTNWSHSTFLLLHRWVAFICMMHAVLHSVLYLHIALHQPGWAEEFTSPYWYWGCGATIGFAILVVKSIQPIRQRMYEVFLAAHIVITALVIVSAYKHVIVAYTEAYGYQNWLWIACAIWGFDRLVRLGRWMCAGYKRAFFTPIDEDYYRLDIPGVSAHGHVYLHFPTISGWRFWENHPFSIAGVTYQHGEPVLSSTMMGDEKEKQVAADAASPVAGPSAGSSGSETDGSSIAARKETGIAVFIRRQGGLTALLAAKGPQPRGIPVFVEGSYNQKMTFLQEDHPEPTHDFPNLLCIAGGVGITGVLPALDRFNTAGKPLGTKKLFWGARTWPLVREVERMQLDGGHHQGTMTNRRWGDVDVTVAVGERFDMKRVLTEELRQQVGGTVVVVCGPAGMVDDVRCIVSALGRHNENGKAVVVKLMIESFTW